MQLSELPGISLRAHTRGCAAAPPSRILPDVGHLFIARLIGGFHPGMDRAQQGLCGEGLQQQPGFPGKGALTVLQPGRGTRDEQEAQLRLEQPLASLLLLLAGGGAPVAGLVIAIVAFRGVNKDKKSLFRRRCLDARATFPENS